ncbi:hypothetical protein [Winogradskya humida]|uniref:DUF4129 domain-containing protein n=1 Tax=Winogradskya humida TaxID=113566 RepID=A0ABQ3ZK89_9ACTN|nr:hypothetical protein [Actinoplanes humidus]GIE18994.1 hypothetical protein Ahu01nite_020960 [Actinoplanes humidus]
MSLDADGGLADLFGAADERYTVEEPPPNPVEKRRVRVSQILGNLLLIGTATVITIAVSRSQGIKISVLLIVVAFVALRLLMFAVSEVAPPVPPRRRARGGEESGDYLWASGDLLRVGVRRWEQQLDWSQNDADRFSRIVLPALSEMADERLRLRHGFTRESDPGRARELMGEQLWQLLNEPGRRAPKPRDLSAFVDALERI